MAGLIALGVLTCGYVPVHGQSIPDFLAASNSLPIPLNEVMIPEAGDRFHEEPHIEHFEDRLDEEARSERAIKTFDDDGLLRSVRIATRTGDGPWVDALRYLYAPESRAGFPMIVDIEERTPTGWEEVASITVVETEKPSVFVAETELYEEKGKRMVRRDEIIDLGKPGTNHFATPPSQIVERVLYRAFGFHASRSTTLFDEEESTQIELETGWNDDGSIDIRRTTTDRALLSQSQQNHLFSIRESGSGWLVQESTKTAARDTVVLFDLDVAPLGDPITSALYETKAQRPIASLEYDYDPVRVVVPPVMELPVINEIGVTVEPTFQLGMASPELDRCEVELYDLEAAEEDRLLWGRFDADCRAASPGLRLQPDKLYYLKTRAWNDSTESELGGGLFRTYPETITLDRSFDFGNPDSLTTADYKLVSIPGDRLVPISDLVSGVAGEDWTAYYQNGKSSGSVEEYLDAFDSDNPTASFSLGPGHGLWVISRMAFGLAGPFRPVPLDEHQVFNVPLHPGWNIVSNPFEIDLDWRVVVILNRNAVPDLGPLMRFENGAYVSEEVSFLAGQAYLLFNPNQEGEQFLELCYGIKTRLDTTVVTSSQDPGILVSLSRNGQSAGQAFFEFTEGASAPDPMPPGAFSTSTVAIVDELSGIQTLRAAVGTGRHFTATITIRNDTGEALDLNVNPVGVPMESFRLLDTDTGEILADSGSPTAVVGPRPSERTVTLQWGSSNMDTDLGTRTPLTLANYPNPFEHSTRLSFSLTSASDTKLVISDALGRKLNTIADERLPSGRHIFSWSPEATAAGVYFATLTVGTRTVSRALLHLD